MLNTDKSVLLVIDVQGKLAQLMFEKEALFDNLQKIIKGAKALGIPIILTEQNPDRLGETIPDLAALLTDTRPISKFAFSCCLEEQFMKQLEALERRQVLIAGIETHVCIYQTAVDLLLRGYEAHVVTDAVSSRTQQNRAIGLQKMTAAGAAPTSVETALFELLKVAKGETFKEIPGQ